MRVLIVDDEAPARAKLRRMLAVFEDVEVAGEAGDGAAALEAVTQLSPDALFLDVQMPEVSGLDVAASLPDDGPSVVFVTAFDRYALKAFDARALDYLLKPVAPERLARAIHRLRAATLAAGRKVRTSAGGAAQLLIPDRGQTHVVRCTDIDWLEAADNYVNVHAKGRELLMRRTLAALLEDLGPAFVRTHRSAAVALERVDKLRLRDKGKAVVMLSNGEEVPCSPRHRLVVMQRMQNSS
jgi:two-component system LytT family response regulator